MTSQEIVFKDPPEPKPGRNPLYKKLLSKVKQAPDEWALIRTYDTRTAFSVATRLRRNHPDFEFRTASTGDGGTELYAKYKGNAA